MGELLKLLTLERVMERGLHLGTHVKLRHPSMRRFIAGHRKSLDLISPESLVSQLQRVVPVVTDVARSGGSVLTWAPQPFLRSPLQEYHEKHGHPIITGPWIAGTLTNFAQIKAAATRAAVLRKVPEEVVVSNKHLNRLVKGSQGDARGEYRGYDGLLRMPALVVMMKHNGLVLRECIKADVPTVLCADTGDDVGLATLVVPSNTKTEGIEIILKVLEAALIEGMSLREHTGQASANLQSSSR